MIDILGDFTNDLSIQFDDQGANNFDLSFSSDLIPVTLEWSPAEILDCTDCPNPSATTLEETEVTLLVTDANGCTATSSTILPYEEIIVDNTVLIYEPTMINLEDSQNDRFFVQSNLDVAINELSIYDRWGNQVFTNRDFLSNDPSEGWDGTFQNSTAEQGVYVYLIRYFEGNSRENVIRGDITVIR